MQTKTQSLFESIANVAIGYVVALVTQWIAFPLVGVEANAHQNFMIGAIFTAVSLARSYVVRRAFNALHKA